MSVNTAPIAGGATAGLGPDPAAQALARAEGARAKSEALIRDIRDKGFRAYVEDMEREKLRALREKILQMMGLNEADLNRMPADQRAAIEKAVSEEIRRRLMADAALKDEGDSLPAAGGPAKGMAPVDLGARLGSLLAAQERDGVPPPPARRKDETPG